MNLKELGIAAHETAVEKGWWENKDRNVPEMLALIHSEVSEALEAYRDNELQPKAYSDGKPIGMPSELADVIIRLVDLAHYLKIDLDLAVETKMAYNKTRPYRHGGKRC